MSTEPTKSDSVAILESYADTHHLAQLTRIDGINQCLSIRTQVQRLHPEIMTPGEWMLVRCMLLTTLLNQEQQLRELVQVAEARFDDHIRMARDAGILPQETQPQADQSSHGAAGGDLQSPKE